MKMTFFLQLPFKIGESTDKECAIGSNHLVDPSGLRIGPPPDVNLAEMLINEVDSLAEYIDKKQVANKVPITLECIEDKIDIIRNVVTKAYPMGLPEWDLAKSALFDPIDKLRGSKSMPMTHLFGHATRNSSEDN